MTTFRVLIASFAFSLRFFFLPLIFLLNVFFFLCVLDELTLLFVGFAMKTMKNDPCNKHGRCIITRGRAECQCYSGWRGSDCNTKEEQNTLPDSSETSEMGLLIVTPSVWVKSNDFYIRWTSKGNIGNVNIILLEGDTRFSRPVSTIAGKPTKIPPFFIDTFLGISIQK